MVKYIYIFNRCIIYNLLKKIVMIIKYYILFFEKLCLCIFTINIR